MKHSKFAAAIIVAGLFTAAPAWAVLTGVNISGGNPDTISSASITFSSGTTAQVEKSDDNDERKLGLFFIDTASAPKAGDRGTARVALKDGTVVDAPVVVGRDGSVNVSLPSPATSRTSNPFLPGNGQHMIYVGGGYSWADYDYNVHCTSGSCGPDNNARGSVEGEGFSISAGGRYGIGEGFHGLPAFLQGGIGYYFIDDTGNLNGNFHDFGDPVNDVFVTVEKKFYGSLGIGSGLCSHSGWDVDGVLGAKATQMETRVRVDEGGNQITRNMNDWVFSPFAEIGVSNGQVRVAAYVAHTDGDGMTFPTDFDPTSDYVVSGDDEVSFGLNISIPIFADGFESGNTSAWR